MAEPPWPRRRGVAEGEEMAPLSRKTCRYGTVLTNRTCCPCCFSFTIRERCDLQVRALQHNAMWGANQPRSRAKQDVCSCYLSSFSPLLMGILQETLAKFKRLLSLARRSIEENQRQISEKDAQLSVLREALAAAENARRRCVCARVCVRERVCVCICSILWSHVVFVLKAVQQH